MTGNCQLIAIDNCKWSELAAEELASVLRVRSQTQVFTPNTQLVRFLMENKQYYSTKLVCKKTQLWWIYPHFST